MAPKPARGKSKQSQPSSAQPQTKASYAMQPTLIHPLRTVAPIPHNWYDQTLLEQSQQQTPTLTQTYAQTTKGSQLTSRPSTPSVVASRPSSSQQVASSPSSSYQVAPRPSQQVASRPSSSQQVAPRPSQQVASRPSSQQVASTAATSTKYFTKTKCEQLVVLLENQTWSEDPFQIPPRVFYPNSHFLQSTPDHTQRFYEFILIDTESIILKKRRNDNNPHQIAYSTVTILKILTPEQWGAHPCQARQFSHVFQPPSFNYYDYQQAWYNTFYFQNANYSHSWMFTFHYDFPFIFPNWFHDWWFYFGGIEQILPPHIHDAALLFQNQFQPPQSLAKFPRFLLFLAQFSIPWICFWNYTILCHNSFHYLGRTFQVKWWVNWPSTDSFSTNDVSKYFSNNPTLCSAPDSHFILARSQNISKLAMTKSKKELRQQLLETLSSLSDSDDEVSQAQDSPISSTDLADDNEDDCFGILPPIQTRSKTKQSKSQ